MSPATMNSSCTGFISIVCCPSRWVHPSDYCTLMQHTTLKDECVTGPAANRRERLTAQFSSVQRYAHFHNGMSCVNLHKTVEPPAIIHHVVAYLPLAPFFVAFVQLVCSSHLGAECRKHW